MTSDVQTSKATAGYSGDGGGVAFRWAGAAPAIPSTAEYCAIGDTTTRFFTVTERRVNGVNIGGTGAIAGVRVGALRSANQRSYPSSHAGSRSRRFSWLIRWLRVSIEYMNCSGSSWSQ